jgi:hypothetical protein
VALKVELGRKSDGKTQAEYIELGYMTADGKAIKPEPTRVRFGNMVVAPEVTIPAHLQALVDDMRARGKTEAEVQAVVSALA